MEKTFFRYDYKTGKRNLIQIPTIVCLCGSTRFYKEFQQYNLEETLAGKIVLSVGAFVHDDTLNLTAEQKIALDELHKRKIDIADEVLILNVGDYIGSSTRSELEYAINAGKVIRFLEPHVEKETT
jgi:cell division protein FtsB